MPIKTDAELASAIMSVIYFPISTASIGLNVACLAAMCRGRVFRKSDAFTLVAVLCVGDIFMSLALFNAGIFRLLSLLTDMRLIQLHCYLFLTANGVASTLPNLAALMMAAERLFVVACPIAGHLHGRKFVHFSVSFSVAITLISTAAGGIGASDTLTVSACVSSTAMAKGWAENASSYGKLLPCGLCCVVYLLLVIALRRHNQRIASQLANIVLDHQQQRRQQNQRIITINALIVCAVFLVFTGVGSTMASIVGPALQATSPVTGILVTQIGGSMTVLSSGLNALILMLRNYEIRRQVDAVWRSVTSCGQVPATLPASSTSGSSQNSSSVANAQQAIPQVAT